MEFPVINITVYLKEEYKISENILDSMFTTQYVYTRDKVFLNFIKQCKFADNRGDIYTIVGFGKAPFWRRITPLSYRIPVIYKRTGESIDFEEIKRLFLNSLDVIDFSDDPKVKKDIIRITKKAKNLKQLEYEIFP